MPNRQIALILLALILTACSHTKSPSITPVGELLKRRGDEIMVAGQLFHTNAPVVLWTDPGGFDAYRTDRRFAPYKQASFNATTQQATEIEAQTGKKAKFADIDSPNRLDLRAAVLTDEEIAKFRGGGWDLESLQQKVDQFVIHFDVAGTASNCFNILHDVRGLSVHFMLDVDGTIYQTCDVKERAFQATVANPRSVGIEIANIGAYEPTDPEHTLDTWYRKDDTGKPRLILPAWVRKTDLKGGPGPYYPARDERISGNIQGHDLEMYDLTPQQYDSLVKLTAALCTALPKITCDYPRDGEGKLIPRALDGPTWYDYQGLVGHYHVQTNKTDPGPAFQWDKVRDGAWALMSNSAKAANLAARGQPVHFKNPPTTWPEHWGLRSPWGATTQPGSKKE